MQLISLASVLAGVSAFKPLEVSLEAPHREVSETLLGLETLNKFNSSSFFPLLSVLLSEREKGNVEGSQSELDLLFKNAVGSQFVPEHFLGAVKADLEVGTAYPYLEGQMNLFDSIDDEEIKKCPVVYWSEGKYSCDKMGLFALQATAVNDPPVLFPRDHVIGTGDHWVVVYADFDDESFPEWHASLLEMALSGKISYVLRHRAPVSQSGNSNSSRPIAGYGVTVGVKSPYNLEIDDPEDGSILQIVDSTKRIKQQQVISLSLEAVKFINDKNLPVDEKMEMVKKIFYNFPLAAHEFTNRTSDDEMMEFLMERPRYSAAGVNALFIDGSPITNADFLNFFDALAEEAAVTSVLKSYMPNNTNVSMPKFLTSGVALDVANITTPELTGTRYDLSSAPKGVISWLNDIEIEPDFASLNVNYTYLEHSNTGVVPIRRNINSVVIVGDLESMPQTSRLVSHIIKQVGTHFPVQVGLVSPSTVWHEVSTLGYAAKRKFIEQLVEGKTIDQAKEEAHGFKIDAENMGVEIVGEDDEQVDPEDISKFIEKLGLDEAVGTPHIFIDGQLVSMETWREQLMPIFDRDRIYLSSTYKDNELDAMKSIRDELFKLGKQSRCSIVNPITKAVYGAWPVDSLIQSFRNPEESNSTVRHSVLLSSSFKTVTDYNIADQLLKRSMEKNDVDLFIRPLAGIHKKFYSSLLDPMYNQFKYSRDLMQAARGHILQNKTRPRVFNVAKEPEFPVSELPSGENDIIFVDGRLVLISDIIREEGRFDLDEILDGLLEREVPRVKRFNEYIPGVDGIGIAGLTSIGHKRTMLDENDIPDVGVKGSDDSSIITVISDPVTLKGQQYIALADLAMKANLTVHLFLSPTDLNKVPSQIFRPVVSRKQPIATFEGLEDNVMYNAKIVEPQAWSTSVKKCDYDLENIFMDKVTEPKLEAVFQLNGLLIEGFAKGVEEGDYVPLDLYNAQGEKIADSLVMGNLNYFQFQVPTPGAYRVCIANRKYSFAAGNGDSTDCADAGVFTYSGEKLRTHVMAQKATKKHLGSINGLRNNKGSSLWGKGKKSTKKRNADQEAEINIFTDPKGQLYDRLASTMILSVMKHTSHSVKFWFVENFVGGKLRELLPILADKYNFQYEFVNYKWPSWLPKGDDEKIENKAYKMLFLDVALPQTLSNVIYLSADQIIRSDINELMDVDLTDSSFAMVPISDERKEADKYRYWTKTFWPQILERKNLKFHTTSLFKANLKTIRKRQVSDMFRQQFYSVLKEPDTINEIDQDIMNFMQVYVPVKSLKNSWAWCALWNPESSISFAQSINLCNNPLAQLSKLDTARKLIPEWSEYDDEVSKLRPSSKKRRTVGDVPNKKDKAKTKKAGGVDHDEL